jgi:hypothetical protein
MSLAVYAGVATSGDATSNKSPGEAALFAKTRHSHHTVAYADVRTTYCTASLHGRGSGRGMRPLQALRKRD